MNPKHDTKCIPFLDPYNSCDIKVSESKENIVETYCFVTWNILHKDFVLIFKNTVTTKLECPMSLYDIWREK